LRLVRASRRVEQHRCLGPSCAVCQRVGRQSPSHRGRSPLLAMRDSRMDPIDTVGEGIAERHHEEYGDASPPTPGATPRKASDAWEKNAVILNALPRAAGVAASAAGAPATKVRSTKITVPRTNRPVTPACEGADGRASAARQAPTDARSEIPTEPSRRRHGLSHDRRRGAEGHGRRRGLLGHELLGALE
jgi:hypothetical protein